MHIIPDDHLVTLRKAYSYCYLLGGRWPINRRCHDVISSNFRHANPSNAVHVSVSARSAGRSFFRRKHQAPLVRAYRHLWPLRPLGSWQAWYGQPLRRFHICTTKMQADVGIMPKRCCTASVLFSLAGWYRHIHSLHIVHVDSAYSANNILVFTVAAVATTSNDRFRARLMLCHLLHEYWLIDSTTKWTWRQEWCICFKHKPIERDL